MTVDPDIIESVSQTRMEFPGEALEDTKDTFEDDDK